MKHVRTGIQFLMTVEQSKDQQDPTKISILQSSFDSYTNIINALTSLTLP